MTETSGQPSGTNDEPVLRYLAAIEARRAAPSAFPDPDRIADDLASAEMMQPTDDTDALRGQLSAHAPGSSANIESLEDEFVARAKDFAERHGMGYDAWIQAGVDDAVLERAGIGPGRG